MAIANGLLVADVAHMRLLPKRHGLRYKVYYLCFPLSRMPSLASRLLSLNRFNLFSFHERDHGFGAASAEAWIRKVLADWNVKGINGEIVLLTLPRLFGHVFNPVSFWFCLDDKGALRAVLSEVSNTFKERHCYLSFHDDGRPIDPQEWLESDKVFHVSPFLPVRGKYHFRFVYSEEKIGVWVDFYDGGEKTVITSLIGTRMPLTDRTLIASFFKYPMITLKVIILIHYHALKLVMKGIRYYNKPQPPAEEITR